MWIFKGISQKEWIIMRKCLKIHTLTDFIKPPASAEKMGTSIL